MKEQNYKDLISLAIELLSGFNVSVVINKPSTQILAGKVSLSVSMAALLSSAAETFPGSSSLTIHGEKQL